MAILYVRSTDGDNADNGSTWALAKATLAGAFSAASAGDTIYVSDVHAESQASAMTLTSPGTIASPVYVICVDDSAEPPTALATTATIGTASGGNYSLNIYGVVYYYGITFHGGNGSGANLDINIASTGLAANHAIIFHECSIQLRTTAARGIHIGLNSTTDLSMFVRLINSTFKFAATGQQLRAITGYLEWIGGGFASGTTVPTTVFAGATIVNRTPQITMHGVDLSAITSGNNLINMAVNNGAKYRLRNCKLASGVTVTTGTVASGRGTTVELINCDSADTNYRYWYQDYAGTIEHETTIVRTGGASDGTTPISREMISSPNSNKLYPLVLSDLVYWNESTGANTLTIHIITDNVTLTDQECWLEVEYLGTSGFPLALTADDADSITDRLLSGTASNQTTSSETWTTTGLTTPVKQQLSVSVTPQEKGPIRCRVVLSKPSTTVYVCPKIEVS